MNAQLQPNEVGSQIFRLLEQILEEAVASDGERDYRTAFVYRHARNIHQLGGETVHLLATGRIASSPIVVRSMLESLFKLVAAVNEPGAAVEILLCEVEEDLGRIKKWLDPSSYAPAIKYYSEFAARLRADHKISSNKKWNTLACAHAANLSEQYREDYFVFSGHTHASTAGIILQEKEASKGYIFQTLLFILVCAAGRSVQVVPTKSPQAHVDEAARLVGELTELIKAGVFSEMNKFIEQD